MSADADETLVEAAAALIAGDSSVVPALLEAWREHRSPALAWLLAEYGPDEHELGSLRSLPTAELTTRVQALKDLPPDPRVAEALVGLVIDPPYTSTAMQPMWKWLFHQITTRYVDARTLARLREADVLAQFGNTYMGERIAKKLARVIAKLAAEVDDAAPTLAEEPALLELLERSRSDAPAQHSEAIAPESLERRMVERCAAAPDDDVPRLIYADWLEANGDATRAEFIRLQIAQARDGVQWSEREQGLVWKHAAEWLAPIMVVVTNKSWTFERGLLRSCTIYSRRGKASELAGHWLWASVRELELAPTGDLSPIITHPVMSNLRVVKLGSNARSLAGLLDSDAPIEELHVEVCKQSVWDAFVACKRLPRLALVRISGAEPEQLRTIAAGGMARPGLRIVYFVDSWEAGLWLVELSRLQAEHPVHTVVTTSIEVEFGFERATRTLRAPIGDHQYPIYYLDEVVEVLRALHEDAGVRRPAGDIAVFELRVSGGRFDSGSDEETVLEAIEGHCRVLGWELRVVGHSPPP